MNGITHIRQYSTFEEDPRLTAWTALYRTVDHVYHPCIWFEFEHKRFTPLYDRETLKEYRRLTPEQFAEFPEPLKKELEKFESYMHAYHLDAQPNTPRVEIVDLGDFASLDAARDAVAAYVQHLCTPSPSRLTH